MLLFSTEHDRDLAPRPLDEDRGREVAGPGLRSAARPCTRNHVPRPRPVKLSAVSCHHSDLVNVEYFVHQTVVFLGDAFPIENFIGIVSPAVTTCKWSTLQSTSLAGLISTFYSLMFVSKHNL